MQTRISDQFRQNPDVAEADAILRNCVHCGFCTATCPTYQLLGDELDGPRGRIYLIKQMLEGDPVTARTRTHLDRCLTCRACETTCPSGVRYGRLIDIARPMAEQRIGRGFVENLKRTLLRKIVPNPALFSALLSLAHMARPFLPGSVAGKIPEIRSGGQRPVVRHSRRMLILEGCAQSVVTANTNHAAARVLDKLGISLVSVAQAGCCGALSHHLSAEDEALSFIRRNIDAWWAYIARDDVEAIISTASGCGVMLKDYGELLKHDPVYAGMARRVSELSRDISEILAKEDLSVLKTHHPRRVAYHSPCTLQHGQKLAGKVESILGDLDIELLPVQDAHLCCGSAGSYSLLQPKISQQLLVNKITSLQHHKPDVIATANVGCQMHLASRAGVPVVHWIELLDSA